MELHALRRSFVCGLLMKRSNGVNRPSVKRSSGDSLQNMCIHCRACCSKLTSQLLMHFTWGLFSLSPELFRGYTFQTTQLKEEKKWSNGFIVWSNQPCIMYLSDVPRSHHDPPYAVFTKGASLKSFLWLRSLCFPSNTRHIYALIIQACVKTKTHHYPWTFKKQFSALLAHSSVLVLMISK